MRSLGYCNYPLTLPETYRMPHSRHPLRIIPDSALVSLCRFHHRAVHEEGFQVIGTGGGRFEFRRPDGVTLPAEAPAARWQGAPLAPTAARLAADGIRMGPHTATPEWYGESLDVAAALDVLWEPPAAAAS